MLAIRGFIEKFDSFLPPPRSNRLCSLSHSQVAFCDAHEHANLVLAGASLLWFPVLMKPRNSQHHAPLDKADLLKILGKKPS